MTDVLDKAALPANLKRGQVVGPKVLEWAEKITASWNAGRDSFFQTGRDLIAAQDDCDDGEWMQLVGDKEARGKIPFGYKVVQMLMKIAVWPKFDNGKIFPLLPNTYAGCYELTKLKDEDFDAALDANLITPTSRFIDIKHFVKKKRREAKHQEVADSAATVPLEDPEFNIIYADPPWEFTTYSEKGKDLAPDQHYPTMADEEISLLAYGDKWIGDCAANDSVLFLWCTPANMVRALAIMEAWGFEYRSHLVWVKDKAGTGFYSRQQHEPILVGVRGKPPAPLYAPSSVIEAPRGKHSAKPSSVRETIEKMYPLWTERQRVELFARGEVPGWTVFGNEASTH